MKKVQVFCFDLINQNQKVNALCKGLGRSDICEINYVNNMSEVEVKKKLEQASSLVIDSSVYLASDQGTLNSPYMSFKGSVFISKYKNIFHLLITSSIRKIYVAHAHDIHWPGIDLQFLCKNIQGIAWVHHHPPIPQSEFTSSPYSEKWGTAHGNYWKNWQYIKKNVGSSIEMPFFVFENEIVTKRKFFDVSVVGSNYKTRLNALEALKTSKYHLAPYYQIDGLIHQAVRKIPLKSSLNTILIKSREINQNFCIERSKASFVCGSFMRYQVSKYFEIPARGSLAFAVPCVHYRHYGFKDGVNCVHTTPDSVVSDLKSILNKPNLLNKMSLSAQQFVKQEHSYSNRISQFINVVNEFNKGHEVHGFYYNGKYETNKC